MDKINKQDYNRQTNYIFVNSRSSIAIDYSVKTIAQSYIALDNRKKVVVLADIDTENKTSIHSIASAKRGKVLIIDTKDKTENEAIPYIVNQTKFGMLIFENKELSVADFNNFKTDVFEKKSLDIIMHRKNLFINSIELSLLKEAKKTLIETGVIKRNFAFRIYPDEKIKFNHKTFKELVNYYGFIDAFGLLLTQFTSNKDNESSLIYNFLKRDSSTMSLNENIIEHFNELSDLLEVKEDLRVELAKFFIEITEEDFAKLENPIKEETQIVEENKDVEELKKEDTEERETILSDAKISNVIRELIEELFKKIEDENIELASLMTNPKIMQELIAKHYSKVENIINIDDFGIKFKEAIVQFYTE